MLVVAVDDQVSSSKTVTSQQLADVLKPCADKISIEILKAIETADTLMIRCTGPYLREELEIGSKKQFYTRIQRLKLQGIIKHGGQGIYVLTTFGKIITGNIFGLVNTCIENSTELQLIDTIINANTRPTKFASENNIQELVKKLIHNAVLRDIVLTVTKGETRRA